MNTTIKHTPGPWIDYAVAKPATAGVYEWRLESASLPGAFVLTAAHMRTRGAGYSDVLSPVFDYWDGYRVHVPAGLQWRAATENRAIPKHEQKLLGIEGLEHIACSYCGQVPRLCGVQRAIGGSVVIGGEPHKLNSWWLECCEWGHTPHLSDPREIERIRRAATHKATGEQS